MTAYEKNNANLTTNSYQHAAEFIVHCLENEGVKYVFGLPGEENIKLVRALGFSNKIRFILVRHEQGASFMADIYGRLTGKAGVCLSTLGPGGINLLLGTADAQTDSSPLVAISAQVGLDRIYKETHQMVDLENMFKPITKWAKTIYSVNAIPEMVRQAFSLAQQERPGATYLGIPQDIEALPIPKNLRPLKVTKPQLSAPNPTEIKQAAYLLLEGKQVVILAGHGVARQQAGNTLTKFAQRHQVPVATTFMAKGVISDENALSLGVIGFMEHDYENFAFDKADVILALGYELQEFDPKHINPNADKTIIHINSFNAEIDTHYDVALDIKADIQQALLSLSQALNNQPLRQINETAKIRQLLQQEREKGKQSQAFPLLPQRIVEDIRQVLRKDDIVLADTGAIKMWMARLYPTYTPFGCIFSNGLSTMSFALPGAIGAKLAKPNNRILAVMGDGSFLMNAQEIETAVREKIDLKVLIWVDNSYGLIKWKMDIEEGAHSNVNFNNPNFVKYAQSFGAHGYEITQAEELKPTLEKALNEPGVSIIACPVDYKENLKLTKKLGELTVIL